MTKSKSILVPPKGLLLVLGVIAFFGCTNLGKENIKKYYFPIQSLKEGMVYEYKSLVHDSLAPEYWYYKTIESDSGTFLVGQFIDPDGSVRQYFREEFVGNGILLRDCILFLPDSLGKLKKVPVQISFPNVFLFEVKDSLEVLLYKIQYREPEFKNRMTTLIRNRRYMGNTTFPLGNEEVDCVVFEIKDIVDTEEEGHLELELDGVELYGKGIGRIYYQQRIDGQVITENILSARYTLEEWGGNVGDIQ